MHFRNNISAFALLQMNMNLSYNSLLLELLHHVFRVICCIGLTHTHTHTHIDTELHNGIIDRTRHSASYKMIQYVYKCRNIQTTRHLHDQTYNIHTRSYAKRFRYTVKTKHKLKLKRTNFILYSPSNKMCPLNTTPTSLFAFTFLLTTKIWLLSQSSKFN